MMPGMGDMATMQMQMDPDALVATFCGAKNPDLAFIDLTIPHHEMAIQAPRPHWSRPHTTRFVRLPSASSPINSGKSMN